MGFKICIDTNIFLNVKSKEEPYYKYSRRLLEAVDQGYVEAIVPTIVIAELCSGYHEFHQLQEKDEFIAQITANPNYRIVNLDLRVADEAGRIRAATGLRLPDAVLIASSLHVGASTLATHDTELTRAEDLIHTLTAQQVLKQLRL